MRKFFLLYLLILILTFFSACGGEANGVYDDRNDYEASEEVQFTAPENGDTIAVLHTDLGDIYLQLFPEYAPMAVDNFIALANEGYYNGLPFHRVERNFLIQTGDATGSGTGGDSAFNGAAFPVEISDKLHHYTGAVGLARPVDNTSGNLSQFYIVQTPENSVPNQAAHELTTDNDGEGAMREDVADAYRTVGGAPSLDNNYTIFAHVFDGMDIVDEIAKTKTGENGTPEEPIFITSIEILSYTEGMSIPISEE